MGSAFFFAPAHSQRNDDASADAKSKKASPEPAATSEKQGEVGLAPNTSKELNALLGLLPEVGAVDLSVTPEWVKTGLPPEGYESFEIIDTNIGMRDDYFNKMTITYDGTVWLGTWQGRVYASDDDGATWRHLTVLPDVKSLFGFAEQKMLLGALRNDGAEVPIAHELVREQTFRRAKIFHFSYHLFDGARITNYGKPLRWPLNPRFFNKQDVDEFGTGLETESKTAAGGVGFALGAGLSSRAPRLSLLLNVLNRPIANISLQRLLTTTAQRDTKARDVARHPLDPNLLFLTTEFGLYRSQDGGGNWVRVFSGATTDERSMHEVTFEPGNPERVYLTGKRGLFVSDDGGNTWARNTGVPEIRIRIIVIDPKEPRYIYVAGDGGIYRSDNRGANWGFSFYHSLKARRNVMWMTLDAFDSNTAYIGTEDGMLVTHNLRTSISVDWKPMADLRTTGIPVFQVESCTRHPGHLYMLTRSNLPNINYGANGPDNLASESWDYGKTWRPLAASRTMGDAVWIHMEPNDPDTLWIMFSRSVVRMQRISKPPPRPSAEEEELILTKRVIEDYPPMGAVMRATLESTRAAPHVYKEDIDRLRLRRWIPSKIHVTARAGRYRVGGLEEDVRFLEDRERFRQNLDELRVVAWARWALPEVFYRPDSAIMIRTRVPQMNEQVRSLLINTVHRNYGELQRVLARIRSSPDRPLLQRAIEETRREYLEAVIDFRSAGFLTRWKEEHR